MTNNYNITGMSCAACSARVEKAVSELDGVDRCSVNLLTNSMTVEGEISSDTVIYAVEKAGYGAYLSDKNKKVVDTADEKSEANAMKIRFAVSVVFTVALMYFSMGYAMWNFWLPDILTRNPLSVALIQMLLTIAVMVINQKFFINGFKCLVKGAPNMDTLVAIGCGASFVYSTIVLFQMSHNMALGGTHAFHYLHDLYFESAAMILTLITVGKMLEAYSKGKTTNAIKSLMELAPKVATIERDGKEYIISADELRVGDIMLVRPGESFAADGVVKEGRSSVDESALTGESIPVDKQEGDKVSTATINKYGFLKCLVTKTGEETSLAKIIKMVSDASSGKAPVAKIADRVSAVFVPVVIVISLISAAVWMLLGENVGFALSRAISVLVISCPCALGLATPVAIMVGSGIGAKNGILYKTARSLEETGKIKVCVFDKTGTITVGSPSVTDIVPSDGVSVEELMKYACSLERKSEHPLSLAIKKYGEENAVSVFEISDFEAVAGKGLQGMREKEFIRGGNIGFISSHAKIPDYLAKKAMMLSDEGKTPLYFSAGERILGFIAVADTLKPDSTQAIEQIRKMGIKTVMLTGDNKRCARAIGKMCGVDEIIAEVAPWEKAQTVESLKKDGFVAMVGDGMNDAPALTGSDVGIAIGAGTDIAIDAADVVVTGSTLSDVASSILISRKTYKNIKQNLFWAFIYNIIGIPLAAGLWIPLLGWEMNPMFGAAAMSLSSFCVVSNALRLNFIKVKEKKYEKESSKMEKLFNIEGMMCPHCEGTVKKVLEEIDGVERVEASHEKKTAILTLSKDVSDDIIIKAITDQGYKVI